MFSFSNAVLNTDSKSMKHTNALHKPVSDKLHNCHEQKDINTPNRCTAFYLMAIICHFVLQLSCECGQLAEQTMPTGSGNQKVSYNDSTQTITLGLDKRKQTILLINIDIVRNEITHLQLEDNASAMLRWSTVTPSSG